MKDKRRDRVTWAHGEGGAKSHAFLRFLSRDAGKAGEGGKEFPPSTFTETIGSGLVLPPVQGTSGPAVKYRIIPLLDRFQLIQRFAS